MKITRRLFATLPAVFGLGIKPALAMPRASYMKPTTVFVNDCSLTWIIPNGNGRVVTVHPWDGQGYPVDVASHGEVFRIHDQHLADFNDLDHIGTDYWEEREGYRYPASQWRGMRDYVQAKRGLPRAVSTTPKYGHGSPLQAEQTLPQS